MKIEIGKYDTRKQHDVLGGIITPLPIALISTVGKEGYNAAPFSLVMPVSWQPPILCVAFGLKKGGVKKHTVRNIEYSGDFVVNIMDERYIKPTIRASANYPSNVDEIQKVGLTAIKADRVKSPLIAEAQVSLECRLLKEMTLNEGQKLRTIIFGEVLLAHVKDELWNKKEEKIDTAKLGAIGRAADDLYCRTHDVFRLTVAASARPAPGK